MRAATGKDSSTLVGRTAEIEEIGRAISAAAGGRGGVMLFTGEPGIGKSSLARHAADAAVTAGLSVYWGFAWEAGGAPAYWPWTQLLRSMTVDRSLGETQLAALGQLLPEVARSGGGADLQPAQARFQLLESVRLLIGETTAQRPQLLILEDLHAADSDSLNLLQHLARHAASLPLLVIGTYREVEARVSANADALLRIARDATMLRLPRLAEADIREYLRLHGDQDIAESEIRTLVETTAGNPMFLTELVALLTRGDRISGNDVTLPDDVQQVIRQQVALLPDATRSLIATASVLGRDFGIPDLAETSGLDQQETGQRLEPAVEAGIVTAISDTRTQFSHALYRDVLYQDLGAARRSRLHLQRAGRLRRLVDRGDADRWPALAAHLLRAGPQHRTEAIAALRRAADRARERLAFDDAAALLEKALAAFGEGPKYAPAERCLLLIDYANALLVKGEIDAGQKYCREAFEIARAIADATLMAKAALTWGTAIVVAKVDSALVDALEQCLAALPEEDAAMRSRIQARLAGAMQPAADPVVPMAMARDAISLARTTDQDEVLYSVLRSAISALMDFAPPAERIPLNREFGALAARFGDVPEQFRSNLRLMIDAAEIADRSMLDDAIDKVRRLAERIGLPHYQWRAASGRAMQLTIEGRFDDANALLDAAQHFAGRAEDLQALVTLALQRFALLIEWDSPKATPLAAIESQLRTAYDRGMADAEFFVAPFIAIYTHGDDPDFAREFVANEALIERTFAGRDRYSLTGLAMIALEAGELALARRAYDALLEFADCCSTLGLMGSCWNGPVAYWLALVDAALDRPEDAERHFRKALTIAASMRSRPYIARIHASMAGFSRSRGDRREADVHARKADRLIRELSLRPVRMAPGASERARSPAQASPDLTFEQDGDVWSIRYGGRTTVLRDSKGLAMLARLVADPESEVHVLDLVGGAAAPDGGNAGELLDDEARAQYRRRVRDLREELEEAEAQGDLGRVDSLRGELDFISRELSRAFGLDGRRRTAGDAAERARVNVRRRIKDAIKRIAAQHPEAGRYLENTIKTGRYCRYSPM